MPFLGGRVDVEVVFVIDRHILEVDVRPGEVGVLDRPVEWEAEGLFAEQVIAPYARLVLDRLRNRSNVDEHLEVCTGSLSLRKN